MRIRPENYFKEYYQKHKELKRQQRSVYYHLHREEILKKFKERIIPKDYWKTYNAAHREVRREQARKSYLKYKDEYNLKKRFQVRTPASREANERSVQKYRSSHPDRVNAWKEARKIPMKPCIKCGKFPSQRHHPDPLKPLEIMFLCPLHHKRQHLLERPNDDTIDERHEHEERHGKRNEVIPMTPEEETRMKDLENKTDITPGEQTVLNALLALDERTEEQVDAQAALTAAQAGNPPPPPPDPVVQAQKDLDDANTKVTAAQKAVDDAEAALVAVPPVV